MEMESDSEEEDDNDQQDSVSADDAQKRVTDNETLAKQQALQNKKHAAYEVTQPAPAAPLAGNVVIRDYDPKKAKTNVINKSTTEKYIISPLTNERIPADKLHEHVRYSTVDPQYKEQRDREQMERLNEEPTNASGTEISRNIAKLAERRTDIFGVGEKGAEQTIIGKKLGEEERPAPRDPKTIWDGQQSTIDSTTRAAQQAITIEQQITEIHRQHGFLPDPTKERIGPKGAALSSAPTPTPPIRLPMPPPPTQVVSNIAKMLPMSGSGAPLNNPPPMMPPNPNIQRTPFIPLNVPPPSVPRGGGFIPPPPPDESNEPPNKRVRMEDSLEPEGKWLQKISGTISVNVSTPTSQEWSLEGKNIELSLDITSTVATLKSSIQEQFEVPASKVKLSYEGLFLKDNYTLAYYNFSNGAQVQLQLKERGGRKK